MNTLVVIPCGARKRNTPHPARDLYTGSYFRVCLAWAARCYPTATLRILSALHGLVAPDTILSPYSLRMGQSGSVQPARLREQAARQGLNPERVVVVGGARYVAAICAVWPHATTPLDDLPPGRRGMGHQLRYLSRATP